MKFRYEAQTEAFFKDLEVNLVKNIKAKEIRISLVVDARTDNADE